uniref:Uncharacterized protein n=1 Tax=Calcidiscus leptoporus TaxID=127549 RepID=A0A7S0J8J8_9EUKA|mmetsp:Transcript_4500/g.10221  ORF Transcript_4500/g.10221 Transcript_4500/m.10221 type:complete len:289 (+) Transcript_4500:114-980(+)
MPMGISDSDTIIFGVGFGTMLTLPLLVAMCLSCYRRRRRRWNSLLLPCWSANRHSACQEMVPTSDGEDDDGESRVRRERRRQRDSRAKTPLASALASARSACSTGLTKVYFRESDWCSRVRKPIIIELPIDGVHSVQELCTVLRHAHRTVIGGQGPGAAEAAADTIAMTIEYQDPNGRMVQVAANSNMQLLAQIGALYVTTNNAPTAFLSSTGTHLAATPLDQAAQQKSSAGESQGLVEVSLAGCCGVQSTYGGLRVTSNTCHADRTGPRQDRRGLSRAAKLRHYMTL